MSNLKDHNARTIWFKVYMLCAAATSLIYRMFVRIVYIG